MSNNQVVRDPVPVDGNAEYKEGTLQDPVTNADELGAYESSKGINAPGDNVDPESVKGNEISQRELSEVSSDNIVDGVRSTRPQGNLYDADRSADAAVDDVLQSGDGTSSV